MNDPNVIVKAILFKKLDEEKLIDFISSHGKTQVVPLDLIAGEKHVIHSINQALKAFLAGRNIAKKQNLEFLIRLTGQRQISRALLLAKPDKKSVFVSWGNSGVYQKFKSSFDFKEIKLPEPKEEKIKAAMEKTATFWLK